MASVSFSRPPETWLGDAQRRLLLVLMLAAAALGLVGWLMPPNGLLYWVALVAAPSVAAVLGYVTGGMPAARRLDRLLMGRAQAGREGGWAPAHPALLPAEAREALERAVVPALLAQLTSAARRAPAQAEPLQALLASARAVMRQPQPPAEATRLLAEYLPGMIVSLGHGRRRDGVAEACALLEGALRGQPAPGLVERMGRLLPAAPAGGQARP